MEFTEDECLVASILISFRSYFPEDESDPPFSWGRRRRRSAAELSWGVRANLTVSEAGKQENAPLPAKGSEPTGRPTPPPVNSPQTPLEYPQTSPGSSDEKQPSTLNKRKAPVQKSGKKLRTMEELKSTLVDSIRTNVFLKTETNRINQLHAELLEANSLLKKRFQELNSRSSNRIENLCDPQQIPRQPLSLDRHHPPPMMVSRNNPRPGLFLTKEAGALARQRRMLICREKKKKSVASNYINI